MEVEEVIEEVVVGTEGVEVDTVEGITAEKFHFTKIFPLKLKTDELEVQRVNKVN